MTPNRKPNLCTGKPGDTSKAASRAREAEELLRECLAQRTRTNQSPHCDLADVESRLGAAVLAVAVTDLALPHEACRNQFIRAESLLLKSVDSLLRDLKAGRRHQQDALARIVRLYQAWETFEPGTGQVDTAVSWQKRLDGLDEKNGKAATQEAAGP